MIDRTPAAHVSSTARARPNEPFGTSPANEKRAGFGETLERVVASLDRTGQSPQTIAADASPSSLLAAQAELYRDAERIELASRLLDHSVSAIKTILQTRI
jgi:hypothetical protein